MKTHQLLGKFLLIVFAVTLSTCFRFFREGEFLGAPITRREIEKLLLEDYEENFKFTGEGYSFFLRFIAVY